MGRNNKHKRGTRNKRGSVRSERRPSLTGRVQLHEHSAYVITENGDYKSWAAASARSWMAIPLP